jgi:hypothetical protein
MIKSGVALNENQVLQNKWIGYENLDTTNVEMYQDFGKSGQEGCYICLVKMRNLCRELRELYTLEYLHLCTFKTPTL